MSSGERTWLGKRVAAVKRAVLPGLVLFLVLALVSLLLAWQVPLPERLAVDGSMTIYDRDGEMMHVFLASDGRWRIPVTLENVDPEYQRALLRFEDKRFEQHLGVDGFAILRALGLNLSNSRVVSGGSTITMQLVRLVEPRPRTVKNKVIEAFRAVQIELRMNKREILQAYLAFVSFGRNVEGVEAGALGCFGHRANHLSPAEVATLLAIPQNPTVRFPSPSNETRLRKARNSIADRLIQAGLFVDSEAGPETRQQLSAEVGAEPVPIELRRMPRRAPHFAYWLNEQRGSRVAPLRSTLDLGIQGRVEERLEAARPGLEERGIQHGAVVVIDHASMEVRALAGNLSYWDDTPGRQIPAFDVRRSPGSTLKPFIYARAIDEGALLPGFLVRDVPVQYGDYSPRNYDGEFRGLVTAEDALSRSLNVPFVRLLGTLGTDPFLGSLRRMGARHLEPEPGWYGLSVAVGGIELTPLEVAGFYATLARDGTYEPLRLLEEEGRMPVAGDSVLSPGASYLTRRALARRDRPGFTQRKELAAVRENIHWKTGTSSGRRDAWAVGSGSRFTVAVWLGNLDNSSSAHLVGADAAGPLFFDLVEALHRGHSSAPDTAPQDLSPIEVCAYSGQPAGRACDQQRTVLARPERVPSSTCPYHRRVEIDESTGLAVGPGCREGKTTRSHAVLVWPASIRRWLERSHGGLPSPPAWSPECSPLDTGSGPRIVHPPSRHVALLVPGLDPEAQQLPLVAEASAGEELEWFLDGAFLGRAGAAERLWWTPRLGRHQLLVSDRQGRTARRALEVRLRN